MCVSKNSGTPESSILIGFSIINHPFWGTTIFGNPHIIIYIYIYIPYHPCMVYLPRFTVVVDFYGFHVGKYTSPMDAMGIHSHLLYTQYVYIYIYMYIGLEDRR